MAKIERERATRCMSNEVREINQEEDQESLDGIFENECTKDQLFEGVTAHNYNKRSLDDLKNVACRRMKSNKVSEKSFLLCLLKDDDFMNGRLVEGSYEYMKVSMLKKECSDRNLPFDLKKSSLVAYLELNDKAQLLRSNLPHLKQVIAQHDVEEDRMLSSSIEYCNQE